MINVPINISWRDYVFQYPVLISDEVSNLYTYQYGVVDQEDEIDPHPYHNRDYVQFVNEDFINLKKSGNSYYNIPITQELSTGDLYNFTIYDSTCASVLCSGEAIVLDVTERYVKLEITNVSDPVYAEKIFVIRNHITDNIIMDMYDENNDPVDMCIFLYNYIPSDGKLSDIGKNYMPDDPNRNIEQGESYKPIPKVGSRKVIFNLPWFRIDNYKSTDYVIRFTMWVSGIEILLGSYLITPDMYKATPYKIYKGRRYSEYVEFYIPDPWALLYEDTWKLWRTTVCGESPDINNTGTSLSVSITPVSDVGEYYNITEGSGIGSANTMISDKSDYFHLNVRFEESSSDIIMDIDYNKTYYNIQEYLKETYLIDIPEENIKIGYDLMITDKNEDTGVIEYEDHDEYLKDKTGWDTYIQSLYDKAEEAQQAGKEVLYEKLLEEAQKEEAKGFLGSKWAESVVFKKSDLGISDWSEYKDGLFLYGYVEILDNKDVVFSIISDPIPITPDIYRYLISTDLDSQPIKLSNISMLDYTIYAVNKINKNVIQVENAKEYKSHIIHPEFFQANKINDMYLHPEVTENICLNLNAYKAKVDFFYIKVEGVIFSEIGRNHSGVIFKIQGNLLPHKVSEGTAYILDSNKELVTTGTFKYIS